MKLYHKQFLDLESEYTAYEESTFCILPFPYEGGISYLPGTRKAPEAVIEASHHLELYDEVLKAEPFRAGITTIIPPDIPDDPEKMIETLQKTTQSIIEDNKFFILIGGDHSITSGCIRAMHNQYPTFSVIQLDAHADLRDPYDGSSYSHACTMSRILKM